MKKFSSLFLALLMLCSLCVPALAAGPQKVNTYTPGQFTDVSADTWCADNVKIAYEYGIMGGKRSDYFDTNGNVTMAQAVVMACRLHSFYCQASPALPTASGDPWYQPYVEYAEAHQFLDCSDLTAKDFDTPASRANFAGALWGAMPDSALPVISSIEDLAIPDVPGDAYYAEAVYDLYRAGILTGNDAKGTFTPDSSISRGAAAAIVGRAVDPSLRKSITLKEAPFEPVPISRLNNLASLKKKLTDAEFQAAYDAAREIVTPLAKLSREGQMIGIASTLRQMFDSGMTYSTTAPHYNDPYGYLVLGTASCAGCTRATGLCLNMLGIPYEHVNENQWGHQWCRVNLNGTYWICDAYGLYCGPEPAPYQHPYL